MTQLRWDAFSWSTENAIASALEDSEAENKVIYIMSSGFDPRMNDGLESLISASQYSRCDITLINPMIEDVLSDKAQKKSTERNYSGFKKISAGLNINECSESIYEDSRPVGIHKICRWVQSNVSVGNYTDVFLDISTMPRLLFLPLVDLLLSMVDKNNKTISSNSDHCRFHIVVSHDTMLDDAIVSTGIDIQPHAVHRFSKHIESSGSLEIPQILFPIIGHGCKEKLGRVINRVTPDAICPVLPFPSSNPVAMDRLFADLRESVIKSDPRDIVYSAEDNPFDLYRQVVRSALSYDEALKELNGARIVLSSFSSKILTLGMALAAVELKRHGKKVGVLQPLPTSYVIDGQGESILKSKSLGNLHVFCLSGNQQIA